MNTINQHTQTADRVALESAIFALLAQRRPGVTICPSEAARAVYPDVHRWRAAMPKVRDVAQQLASEGRLVVTQRGKKVDIAHVDGPIRLRLPTLNETPGRDG